MIPQGYAMGAETHQSLWLCEENQQLGCIISAVTDQMSMMDRQYNIVWANSVTRKMFGEDILGKKCYDVYHHRDTPCESCIVRLVFQDDRTHEDETEITTADGKTLSFWCTASVARRDNDGRPERVFEVARDITHIKRTEADLKRQTELAQEMARKAEEASRVKSDFLANMSHEIRTPMTAILGFTEILLREAAREDCPAERLESLRTIQRNGKHLMGIIDSILDISKIESGMLEVERAAFSPRQMLEEIFSSMNVRAAAKNILMRFVCCDDVPGTICTDPLRLRQILINLIDNAVKFTDSGSVRVEARLLLREGRCPQIRFDVSDTGMGMDERQMEKLFRPFTQADGSSTRRFGGTGLGLTISKRLAQLLGGDILVSSTPGVGSTFSLFVDVGPINPAAPPDKSDSRHVQRKAIQPGARSIKLKGRILLAEDGADNQRLISFILGKAGADVEVVENGKIAVERALAAAADNEPFDLILLDMQMPVMDGYTAAATLHNAGCHCPIVALTADAMEGTEAKCLRSGCRAYVKKPINWDNLLSIVAAHMQAKRLSEIT